MFVAEYYLRVCYSFACKHPNNCRATDNADKLTLRLTIRQDLSVVRASSGGEALRDPVYVV